MIIVRLFGGLGNQLFQYALARQLSVLGNVPIKLDISRFYLCPPRKYSLHVFNIVEDFASKRDVAKFERKGVARFRSLAEKVLPYYRRSTVFEKAPHYFDPNVFKAPADVYLNGYWQSERYFESISDIVRREFSVKIDPDADNARTLEIINSVNAVSMHIRRADYVAKAAINQFHGICSIEYYQQASEIIATKVPSPHFFVFSDDISWAQANIVLKYPTTFISHNGPDKEYEDLRLMSRCNHQIIANSTFSWWGAWLNDNPQKTVIAPKKWFNDPGIDTTDLIPSGWIRI